jgi:predicted ATPase
VINGIRRAIATEQHLAAADATIQFFSADPEDRPQVAPIAILPHGELSEWPPGFFDQMDTDLAEIARTRRRGRP